MTTIATDGKTVAADGQAIDHCETIVDLAAEKMRRLNDGRIAAAAGNSFDFHAWVDWLNDEKREDCPITSDNFYGIIVSPDRCLWVDHKGREIETPLPVAIGSGGDFALGAMAAGSSPLEAVEIAARYDTGTGGETVSMDVAE